MKYIRIPEFKKLDPKKVGFPYNKLTEKEQYSIYLAP